MLCPRPSFPSSRPSPAAAASCAAPSRRRAYACRQPRGPRRARAASAPERPYPSGSPASPPARPGRWVVLGSAGVILIAVVLAVTGAFGGEDSSSASASATTIDHRRRDRRRGDPGGPAVAAKGSDATGTATFGIADADQPYVDLDISNLEPAPQGKAYVIWLLLSAKDGPPAAALPGRPGRHLQRPHPDPAAFSPSLAARTQAVAVSLAEQKPLLREVNKAVSAGRTSSTTPRSSATRARRSFRARCRRPAAPAQTRAAV